MELEEDRRKRVEERCVELELEIVKRKSEYEALEVKFRALEGEKVAMEEEIRALKRGSNEIKANVNGGGDEKRKLGVNVVDLSSTYQSPGKGLCHMQAAGTPPNLTLYEHSNGTTEQKRSDMEYGNVSKARKQLEFKEDMSPYKKMAPPTPGGARPMSLSVIDISDSDDELTIAHNQKVLPADNQGNRKKSPTKRFLGQRHPVNNDQENVDAYNEEVWALSTTKRKRASNVVTSDSESSDDNIPIITVKRRQLQGRKHDQVGSDVTDSLEIATASAVDNVSVTSPKRRLVRLRKCGGKGQAQRSSSQTSESKSDGGPNKDVEEEEPEEVGSESEGESLGGFIVNSSDFIESNDGSSVSNSVSDDDVNFEEVLSTFQRSKDHNTKWEFEADMLAAFGKDPELCMKAVCALNRQQIYKEKNYWVIFSSNGRGFNKFDASRGSELAGFLTGGDPYCDLRKTVEELEEHDSMAIEICRKLATRYSKQLFEIYENKEDPLFLPS